MADDIKRFTLRMPNEMFDKMKELADTNMRPVSKEILVAIREYLEEHNKN